ncbi:MAG: hypothetical protein E2O52_09240 [Gammaproteobacteria bacterium]|nr:MAG: hypothetical protein E2O52_09240 [Gammaproteobacteria bacterium]
MNAERVLAGIESLTGAEIVRAFDGGPASQSYLVRHHDTRYVLRIDTPIARMLNLDRVTEAGLLAAVAEAGLGPEPIFTDAGNGVLVTRYLEGRAWTEHDLHADDALERLAELLKQVHGLPAIGRPIELPYKLSAYARAIGSSKADELAIEALDILAGLGDSDARQCLCHNDVTCANVIDGDRLALIDWEYAALGDPFFDLATVVQHHGLDDSQATKLLRIYLGQAVDEDIHRLRQWCELYGRLAALWEAAVEQFSGPD